MSKGIWATVDVPTMWLSAEAADTHMAWDQVGAWSRTYELLLFHESRLKTLQLELSAAWPPSRSPAAAAFVEHMEGLLARVSQARHDAAKNRDALKLLLESLASAKKDMAPLKKAWDEFEAQQAAGPRPYKGETWQEALNAKARARMDQNDREVFEATQAMVVPGPGRFQMDDWKEFENEPPAELVNERERHLHSGLGDPLASSSGSTKPASGAESQLAGTSVGIPSLAGSIAPAATALPNAADSAPGRVPPITSPLPGFAPGFGTARQSVASASRLSGGGAGVRSLPTPNALSVPPTGGAGGQRPGVRVNPVGGVISQSPAGMAGLPPSRAGGSPVRTGESSRAPVPILQWEVAQGGVPVIEPPVERPFELGPGVIGIDR